MVTQRHIPTLAAEAHLVLSERQVNDPGMHSVHRIPQLKSAVSKRRPLSGLAPEVITRRLRRNGNAGQVKRVHPEQQPLALAAVLVPLLRRNGQWQLLLIRRARTVATHRGQIAFPGGRWETGDDSLLATALRETQEELGVACCHIRPLGSLNPEATTSTGFLIHPYVAVLPSHFRPVLQLREVAKVITIPLQWLPAQSATKGFIVGSYFIWGATARIINQFTHRLRAY